MKVLELLDEIEEIMDTSTKVPLTGKTVVDAEEILEIVKEIRMELPDEIQQAQWIKDERQRILEEAKKEYDTVLTDAKRQAEVLVENDDIVVKAKMRADEIMRVAESNVKELKLNTFEYIDGILYNFYAKMEQMQTTHFADMFHSIENTFTDIKGTLDQNRKEISDLTYNTQMDKDA